MTGADNILYLDLTETSVDTANNRSLVHWVVRLYIAYGVNANQTGNAYVNGTLVWNYAGNPGNLTFDNTYTLAAGDIWIGHDGSGNGTASGSAHLQTNTTGQPWSFNKNASNAIGLTHINLATVPGAPGFSSNTATGQDAVTLAWTAAAANGAAVDLYEWRLWDAAHSYASPNTSGTTAGLSTNVGGLWPSSRYYWGVRAHNSQGWGAASNTGTAWWVVTWPGAWVKVAGVWKMAKVWAKVGTTWRLVKVWKKAGGVWRV